jgi:hypothetical protein
MDTVQNRLFSIGVSICWLCTARYLISYFLKNLHDSSLSNLLFRSKIKKTTLLDLHILSRLFNPKKKNQVIHFFHRVLTSYPLVNGLIISLHFCWLICLCMCAPNVIFSFPSCDLCFFTFSRDHTLF